MRQTHKAKSRYKWRHGALCLYCAVMLRDPQLLISWLDARLPSVPLFQHRRFFRLLAFLLRSAVLAPAFRFQLQGLYFYLVGKISVTGNSRSRSFLLSGGRHSGSNMQLRVSEGFTLVRTNTGCLGLTVRFFF